MADAPGEESSSFVEPISTSAEPTSLDSGRTSLLHLWALGGSVRTAAGAVSGPAAPPPQIGAKYRHIRHLGAGAMGQVHLYRDLMLERDVAIKLLARATTPARLARLRSEGQILARLRHPNVLSVYEADNCGDAPYLVSEYVDGQPLSRLPLPLPWIQVLRIATELADGLAAAHRQGILHRDIKPDNVMLAQAGHVVLCDFGLAKVLEPMDASYLARGAPPPSHSRASTIAGTPRYMAPELWRGAAARPSSDIYALGVLLYQLCSGQTLFPACRQQCELIGAVTTRSAPPLRLGAPSVPRGLRRIIERCVCRDPDARFPSAVALLAALLAFARLRRAGRHLRAALALGLVVLGVALCARAWQHLKLGRMALIPAGAFVMGSTTSEIEAAFRGCQSEGGERCARDTYQREQSPGLVQLAPYFLDRTEVSSARFADWLSRAPGVHRRDSDDGTEKGRYIYQGAVRLADLHRAGSTIEAHGSGFRARKGAAQRPMVLLTWEAARRYCVEQGKRLPSEAEWEFAARGSQRRTYPWGHQRPGCSETIYGRALGYGCAGAARAAQDVGTTERDQTPEGVLDLGGNVQEWTADHYQERAPGCAVGGCADPGGADTRRVIRGGSWELPLSAVRAAARSRLDAGLMRTSVGFRCARSKERP